MSLAGQTGSGKIQPRSYTKQRYTNGRTGSLNSIFILKLIYSIKKEAGFFVYPFYVSLIINFGQYEYLDHTSIFMTIFIYSNKPNTPL